MITLQQLAKRDKYICHICGQRVVRLSDATREHLMPKKFGGSNTNANIALAHIWCNKAKGHKIFRVEQDSYGYVIVDPDGTIVSDPYISFSEAYAVVADLNNSKLYMHENYGGKPEEDMSEIVIIRRVQDNPM